MQEFAEIIDDGSESENILGGVTNTCNHENVLSQDLQYIGFLYKDKTYILLQIHNGADLRGGYTKPQILEVPEPDYFIFALSTAHAYDDKGHSWWSDECGSHWISDDDESNDLELEEKEGKAYHKGCGSEVHFIAMESY